MEKKQPTVLIEGAKKLNKNFYFAFLLSQGANQFNRSKAKLTMRLSSIYHKITEKTRIKETKVKDISTRHMLCRKEDDNLLIRNRL